MDPKTCVVLCPAYHAIEPKTDAGLLALSRAGYPVRVMRGASCIDLARSVMATEALKDGFEETLWIDSDVVFDPEDVERLRSHGLPFVAGLYPKKNREGFAAKFWEGTKEVQLGGGGELLSMEGVGMGFTLIRREVYENVAESLPTVGGGYEGKDLVPYFLPILHTAPDGKQYYLSEDFSFCARAQTEGYVVFADLSIKLGHIGQHIFTWDDFGPVTRHDTAKLRFGPTDEPTTTETEEPPPMAINDNECRLYEKIGRQHAQLEALNAAYDALLCLLGGVVVGGIDRSRVLVNITGRAWELAPEGQRPAMPAQSNGLPVVVVAPEVPMQTNGEVSDAKLARELARRFPHQVSEAAHQAAQ